MHHREHAVLALATLVLGGSLATAAAAVELTGPSTPAAPSACAAPALQLAPPSVLTRLTAAVELVGIRCACGSPLCLGKTQDALCGEDRFCEAVNVCANVPDGFSCLCISAP